MFNISPLIASRKKLLINAFLDYVLVIILFYFLRLDFFIFKIFFTVNVYAFCWILVSYIIGRYSETQDIMISRAQSNISNTISTLFLTGILFKILLIINSYFYKNINLILILSLTAFTSYLLSNIQSYFFNKLSSENLKWISIFSHFQEISKLSNISNITKYGLFKSIKSSFLSQISEKYDKSKFGFVIEDIDYLTNPEKSLLIDLKNKGYKIYNIVYWTERFLQRYPVDIIDNTTILNSLLKLNFKDKKYRIKRIGETLLALFLIFLTLPFICFFAILIKLEDNGPVFYIQKRCGIAGRVFDLLKLRTMKIDAERDGIRWSSKNDKRVTRIGSFLRVTRFDEIPQLFSVLKGDMSLIGPRPERPEIDKFLISKISNYNLRYLVKPGISGWSQVNYPYGASVEDAKNKLSYDIFYIKNHSTILDIFIMFETIRLVLNLRGSNPKS